MNKVEMTKFESFGAVASEDQVSENTNSTVINKALTSTSPVTTPSQTLNRNYNNLGLIQSKFLTNRFMFSAAEDDCILNNILMPIEFQR